MLLPDCDEWIKLDHLRKKIAKPKRTEGEPDRPLWVGVFFFFCPLIVLGTTVLISLTGAMNNNYGSSGNGYSKTYRAVSPMICV